MSLPTLSVESEIGPVESTWDHAREPLRFGLPCRLLFENRHMSIFPSEMSGVFGVFLVLIAAWAGGDRNRVVRE